VLEALVTPEVKILAIEQPASGVVRLPDGAPPAEPRPGERVVMFGPQQAFDALRSATG